MRYFTQSITLALVSMSLWAESGPGGNPYSVPQQATRGIAQAVQAPGLPADYQGAEVAVILTRGQFIPSTIKLRTGMRTRLVFATVNPKPGALVIEGMNLQRWVPNGEPAAQRPPERIEIEREVASDRVTEIVFDPISGNFPFHDALSGARGEIVVE